MRMEIEQRHLDRCISIAKEANNAAKNSLKNAKEGYERTLLRRDISAESKKKKIAKALHELIIRSFSINLSKIANKKKAINRIKSNADLIRKVIRKIEDINNYLEENLLMEIGIIKKSMIVEAIKSAEPIKYLEKNGRVLSKSYLNKVEHTVYELMDKIIFFDRKLFKDYRKKEVKVISNERLELKNLQNILMAESELLETLEAKMPPASKVREKLFKRNVFNQWVPMIFALLAGFESEYEKEAEIFSIIKKDARLKKRIDIKIKHIVSEKEKMLRIKEKREMAMESFEKISDDLRQTFHDYVSAASL